MSVSARDVLQFLRTHEGRDVASLALEEVLGSRENAGERAVQSLASAVLQATSASGATRLVLGPSVDAVDSLVTTLTWVCEGGGAPSPGIAPVAPSLAGLSFAVLSVPWQSSGAGSAQGSEPGTAREPPGLSHDVASAASLSSPRQAHAVRRRLSLWAAPAFAADAPPSYTVPADEAAATAILRAWMTDTPGDSDPYLSALISAASTVAFLCGLGAVVAVEARADDTLSSQAAAVGRQVKKAMAKFDAIVHAVIVDGVVAPLAGLAGLNKADAAAASAAAAAAVLGEVKGAATVTPSAGASAALVARAARAVSAALAALGGRPVSQPEESTASSSSLSASSVLPVCVVLSAPGSSFAAPEGVPASAPLLPPLHEAFVPVSAQASLASLSTVLSCVVSACPTSSVVAVRAPFTEEVLVRAARGLNTHSRGTKERHDASSLKALRCHALAILQGALGGSDAEAPLPSTVAEGLPSSSGAAVPQTPAAVAALLALASRRPVVAPAAEMLSRLAAPSRWATALTGEDAGGPAPGGAAFSAQLGPHVPRLGRYLAAVARLAAAAEEGAVATPAGGLTPPIALLAAPAEVAALQACIPASLCPPAGPNTGSTNGWDRSSQPPWLHVSAGALSSSSSPSSLLSSILHPFGPALPTWDAFLSGLGAQQAAIDALDLKETQAAVGQSVAAALGGTLPSWFKTGELPPVPEEAKHPRLANLLASPAFAGDAMVGAREPDTAALGSGAARYGAIPGTTVGVLPVEPLPVSAGVALPTASAASGASSSSASSAAADAQRIMRARNYFESMLSKKGSSSSGGGAQ